MTKPVIRNVSLSTIVIDPDVQPRSSLDQSVIARYEDLYRTGETNFPPYKLHEINGQLYLCDGFTRHAGATRAGIKTHKCEIRQNSTMGALMVDAVRLNSIHGQPLTQADRRKAAVKLVKAFDESGTMWSQSEIASIVGLSQPTVSRIIKEDMGDVQEPDDVFLDDEPDFIEQATEKMLRDEEESEQSDNEVVYKKQKEIEELIERGQQLPDRVYNLCREITAALRACEKVPGCENVVANMTTLMQAKETLLSIREMRPEIVCPNCAGYGCEPCKDRGWLTRNQSKRIR